MDQTPRPKILLVDDNRHFLELEKEFLKQCSVMIYTAETGAEALDIVNVVRPDLVFLDLYMPNMDGDECCAAIKSDPDLRQVPVIMVTSADRPEDHQRCLTAGCDGILVKPVDRQGFIDYGHRFLPRIDAVELRVPCRTPVMFETGGRCLYGTGVNISMMGMFISTDATVEVEDRIELSFFLQGDGGGVIEAAGRIAWINDGRKKSLPDGFGVEFLKISAASVEMIRKYVDGVEEPVRYVEDAYIAESLF